MAARKPALGPTPHHPELERLLDQAKLVPITDELLREQKVSFAYGNAPAQSRITKESVRAASNSMRMLSGRS